MWKPLVDGWTALRTASPYTGITCVVGLLIWVIGWMIEQQSGPSVFVTLLQELAIALLVTGVVVFGIEWRGLGSGLFGQSDRFQDALVKVARAADCVNDSAKLVDALNRQEALNQSASEVNLMRAMEDRIGGGGGFPQHMRPFTLSCAGVVSVMAQLAQRRGWADYEYAEVIADMFRSVAENAASLAQLGESDTSLFVGHLVNRAPESMVDQVLASHMKALAKGDSYLVVSDVRSWTDQSLGLFRAAHELAVKEGVTVKRIFNLSKERLADGRESREEVEDVLRAHLRYSREWNSAEGGSYVVLVLAARGNLSRFLREAHFGLFVHGGSPLIRVEVRKPDLSDLGVSASRTLGEQYLKQFMQAERAAIGLTGERELERILELAFAPGV